MIEDHLITNGLISESDLQRARKVVEPGGASLPTLLVRMGYISEVDLAESYCASLALPRFGKASAIQPSTNLRLPLSFLREAMICPVSVSGAALTVAAADPENTLSIRSAELATAKKVDVVVATRQEVEELIDQIEGREQSRVARISNEISAGDFANEDDEVRRLRDMAAEAPVVRLVNLLITRAIDARASDMHIEPFPDELTVRYRIDGVLRKVESPPREQARAISSRIKLIGDLDIAERRLPQDGRCQFQHDGTEIDLRISTFPTIHGESVVVRILNVSAVALDLHRIGFSSEVRDGITNVLQTPNGIFLATGPTGSGKTTTLYAALQELNSPERKILTVEDPVEYQIDGINQLQVKPQIGLDFPRALRSIVRQDPDVILIGEMRDLPTSRIAIQSALTGHLVLSTLHTNDAGSSVTRLLDMGIENFLVTSTLRAVLAQRLIRTLCDDCRVSTAFEMGAVAEYKRLVPQLPFGEQEIFRAGGCSDCEGSGYLGRSVIAELMLVSQQVSDLVMQRAQAASIQSAAIENGMMPMLSDGLLKVIRGETSLEEIARVTTLNNDEVS